MSRPAPSAPGTGPAGRRLLSALDRATNVDTDLVHIERTDRRTWVIEGRGKAYAAGTVRTLIEAGLVEELTEGDLDPELTARRTLRLTRAGAALLGA